MHNEGSEEIKTMTENSDFSGKTLDELKEQLISMVEELPEEACKEIYDEAIRLAKEMGVELNE